MVSVTNIVLAILCFLGLGCGFSFIILVTELMNFIKDRLESGHAAEHGVTPNALMIGSAYIIPGLVGMIACCVHRKRMYIGHMLLAISILGILAVLFFKGMTEGGLKANGPKFCEMTNTGCQCKNEEMRTLLHFFSCREINRMIWIGISTDIIFWGGWIITLITASLSGNVYQSLKTTPVTNQATAQGHLSPGSIQQFSSNPYKRLDQ